MEARPKPALPRSKPGIYGPRPYKSSVTGGGGSGEAVLTGYSSTSTTAGADVNANPVAAASQQTSRPILPPNRPSRPSARSREPATRPSEPPARPSGPPPRPGAQRAALGPKPALKAKPSPTNSPKPPPRRSKNARTGQQKDTDIPPPLPTQPPPNVAPTETEVMDYEEEPRRLGRRILVEIDPEGDVSSSTIAAAETSVSEPASTKRNSRPGDTEMEAPRPKRDSGSASIRDYAEEPRKRTTRTGSGEGYSSTRNQHVGNPPDDRKSTSEKMELGKYGSAAVESNSVQYPRQAASNGSRSADHHGDRPRSQETPAEPMSGRADLPIVTVRETPVYHVERFTLVEGSVRNVTRNSPRAEYVPNSNVQQPLNGTAGQSPEETSPRTSFGTDPSYVPRPRHSSQEDNSRVSVSPKAVSLKGPESPILEDQPHRTSIDSCPGRVPSVSGKRTSSDYNYVSEQEVSSDHEIPKQRVSLKGPKEPILQDEPSKRTSVGPYSSPASSAAPSPGFGGLRQKVSLKGPEQPVLEQELGKTTSGGSYSSPLTSPAQGSPRQRISLKGPQPAVLQDEAGKRTSVGAISSSTSSPCQSPNVESPRQRISLKGPQPAVLQDEAGKRTSVGAVSSSTSSPCQSPNLESPRQRISLKGPQPAVLQDEAGKRTSIGSYSSPSSSPCSSPSVGGSRQRISLKGPQPQILQDQSAKRTSVESYPSPASSPCPSPSQASPRQSITLKGPQPPVLEESVKRTSTGSHSSPLSSPGPSMGSPRQRVSLKGPQQPVVQEDPGNRTSVGSYSSPVSSPCASPGLGSPRQRISLKGPQPAMLQEEPGKGTSGGSEASASPRASPGLGRQRVSLKGPSQPVLQQEPGKRTSVDSYSSPSASPSPSPSLALGSPRDRVTLKGPVQPVLEDQPDHRVTGGPVSRAGAGGSPTKKPNLRGPPQRVLEDSNPKLLQESPKSPPEAPPGDIKVIIEKIQSVGSGERKRVTVGTETFPYGTTANDTCSQVAAKYGSKMGIWLLQRRVSDPENHPDVEDGCYVTVRESQHTLQPTADYSAVYFSGSQMFIFG